MKVLFDTSVLVAGVIESHLALYTKTYYLFLYMISLQQRVTISPEVLSQEVDGETVLLDLESESYFGLDEVGTRIWQLLNETSNLRTIFDTLLDEYDVDEQQLDKDFQGHLAQLVDAGLISLDSTEQ